MVLGVYFAERGDTRMKWNLSLWVNRSNLNESNQHGIQKLDLRREGFLVIVRLHVSFLGSMIKKAMTCNDLIIIRHSSHIRFRIDLT